MTKEDFLKELEHIAESGSNEIRLGKLFEQITSSLESELLQLREDNIKLQNHIHHDTSKIIRLESELAKYKDQDKGSTLLSLANEEMGKLIEENARLKNDLMDALDLKEGKGPTALSMLKAEVERLKNDKDDFAKGFLKWWMENRTFTSNLNELIKMYYDSVPKVQPKQITP